MTSDRSLPDGWLWVRFGDVVQQVKDRVDPQKAGLTRYVAGEHMDTDDLRLQRWGEVDEGYLGPAFHMRFRPGQVLYGSRRTYLRKVAVADFKGICANTTFVLEPSTAELLPEFLPQVMSTERFHEHSVQQSKGSVNPYINFRDLTWFEFALPPLDVQQEVSTVLEGFENYINALAHTIESVRTLEGAIANEVNRDGSPSTLSELASNGGIQIGPFGSQLHAHEYVDEGVPVVMPADLTADGLQYDRLRRITEETAERLSKHRVCTGDILLPRRGDLNKRALINEHESGWLCGTGSVRVRLDDPGDAPLVVCLLRSTSVVRWLEMNAVGTTMPNLNADIVSRIPVTMPEADKRPKYADLLSSATALTSALDAAFRSARRARMTTLNELLETPSGV